MDAFTGPDPARLPTAKPFVGRAVVMRLDEALAESATLRSDLLFMRRLGVRPLVVYDPADRRLALRLIGDLNRLGGAAVNLEGASASTLVVSVDDAGATAVRSVNAQLVSLLLGEGYIPVFASEGADISGRPAPLDGDDAARALAGAVHAVRLMLNASTGGVPSDSEGIIAELTASEALALAEHGALAPQLAHRLVAAALGVRGGVGAAQLLDLTCAHATVAEMLTARHLGTQVVSNVLLA
jgi:acetylglutamate kinase